MKILNKKFSTLTLLRAAQHSGRAFARLHTRTIAAACFLLAAASPAQAVIQAWDTHPVIPASRFDHASAAVTMDNGEKRVFVFGGTNESQRFATVLAFDPEAGNNVGAWDPVDTWTDIPTPIVGVSCAASPAGKIYLVGGQTIGNTYSSTIYIFDPNGTTIVVIDNVPETRRGAWTSSEDTESMVPSLEIAREKMGVMFGPDGMLYTLGGKRSGAPYRILKRASIDETDSQWEYLADFPEAHVSKLGLVATGRGTLFAAGRKSYSECNPIAYEYTIDPAGEGSWAVRTPMPEGFSLTGCLLGSGLVAGPDGFIYAVNDGNYNEPGSDETVYRYNIFSDSWDSNGINTGIGGTDVGVAVLDGRVYVTGGTTRIAPGGGYYPQNRIESLETGIARRAAEIVSLRHGGTNLQVTPTVNACTGQAIDLNVSVDIGNPPNFGLGVPIRWSVSKDGIFKNGGTFSTLSGELRIGTLRILDTVTAADAGEYVLRVWNNFNLTDPDRVTFEVSLPETATIVSVALGGEILGDETLVCLGGSNLWVVELGSAEPASWEITKENSAYSVGGSTTGSFIFPFGSSIQSSSEGEYVLRVWNDCNNATIATLPFSFVVTEPLNVQVPSLQLACPNDTVEIQATVSGGKAPYRFRLMQGANPGDWTDLQNSPIYTFEVTAESTTSYTVVVSDECGHSVNTLPINLAVADAMDVQVAPLPIACENEFFDIEATVSGGKAPYRFRLIQGTTPGDWTDPQSSPIYTFREAAASSASYTVEVLDGCGNPVPSLPVDIFVKQKVTSVQLDSPDSSYFALCVGSPLDLAVSVNGTAPFDWQLINTDTGVVVPGTARTSIFPVSISNLPSGDPVQYILEVGNGCNNTPERRTFTVYVQAPPAFMDLPADLTQACAGQRITLSSMAVGNAAIAYQWFKDDGSGPSPMPGRTFKDLILDPAQASDSATYTVEVSDASLDTCGPVVSSPASVVQVVGAPSNVQASQGTYIPYVELLWDPAPFPSYQRVNRYDSEDSQTPHTVADWMMGATMTLDDPADPDDQPTPGYCYYYSVESSLDGVNACESSESPRVEGYRQISPVTHVVASDYIQEKSYILIGFNGVHGATNYQILRSLGSNGDSSGAVRVHGEEWIDLVDLPNPTSGTLSGGDFAFRDYTALPETTYTYWVVAGP
ncbi:MAG: hypothetical protein GY762_06535, partial [Proteobacteria bacterium]|nr:hypothetical protein [Pseudomonadota bacterium]